MTDYKLNDTEIGDAVQLIKSLKEGWNTTYETFADYRLMSAGELPKEYKERLKKPEYEQRSKLRTRVIADAIKDLRSYVGYELFRNPDGAFEFIPFEENDTGRAKKATDLVSYCWYRTHVKRVCKAIIEDIAQVGTGYSMINQWIDRRYVPQPPVSTIKKITNRLTGRTQDKFKVLYRGPKLVRLKTELVYPQKVKEWNKVSAIARMFTIPYSRLKYESATGGLTSKYVSEIKRLEKKEFEEPDKKFEIHKDNEEDVNRPKIKDFPVLCGELWQNCTYGDEEYPTWYRLIIADFDLGGEDKPIIINFDRDPMETGMHNIIHSTIFPVPDRLNGNGVPEMIQDLSLEMFTKRNQVIDYTNLLFAIHGTVWGRANGLEPDDITVQTGRYKALKTGSPKDLHTVQVDITPLTAGYNEMGRIDRDVQNAVGSNEITSGRNPIRREAATIGALIDENAKIRQTDRIEEAEETIIKRVANGYLMQIQTFMTSDMRIRVLGRKKAFEWELVRPEEIQGAFDIRCVASSRIMPRAMKQANLNAFMQTFANNPYIAPKLDWIPLYKDVCDILEMPKAKGYIRDPSKIEEDIRREEEFMIANPDMPWAVTLSEDHPEHLSSHMQKIAHLPNGKMHISEHVWHIRQLQGQNGGQESAAYANSGELLNDVSAGSSAKALGR